MGSFIIFISCHVRNHKTGCWQCGTPDRAFLLETVQWPRKDNTRWKVGEVPQGHRQLKSWNADRGAEMSCRHRVVPFLLLQHNSSDSLLGDYHGNSKFLQVCCHDSLSLSQFPSWASLSSFPNILHLWHVTLLTTALTSWAQWLKLLLDVIWKIITY